MKILIAAIGNVENSVIVELWKTLAKVFGCTIEIGKKIEIPAASYNKIRNQHEASVFFASLKKLNLSAPEKVLGVTSVDLFAPGLNFVFGQAEPNLNVAVISLFRLHDENKLLERTCKEAVHELGHTFGLKHCADVNCVMHFSNSLHDTDIKQINFCSHCQPKLIR